MSIFIIAEIGINHNGDMAICKELIDLASDTGCNAVKFQKRDIDSVYKQEFYHHIGRALGVQLKESKKKGWNLDWTNTKKLITTVNPKKLIGLLLPGI